MFTVANAEDFYGDTFQAVKFVIYLCDLRDSEMLTLKVRTLAQLKTEARAEGVFFRTSIKKADLIAAMIEAKCHSLSGNH